MEVIKEESFEIDVEELATKKEEDQKDEAARALHLKPDYVRKCKMPLQDKEYIHLVDNLESQGSPQEYLKEPVSTAVYETLSETSEVDDEHQTKPAKTTSVSRQKKIQKEQQRRYKKYQMRRKRKEKGQLQRDSYSMALFSLVESYFIEQ